MGKAYNFSAEILPGILTGNQEDISFEVKHIEDWNTFSSYSQILVASKLAGIVTLNNDVEFTNCVEVVDSLTINLNAHKIEYLGSSDYLFNVYRDGYNNYDDGDKTIFTINGNKNDASTIASKTEACIATIDENSKIIINGGHHITDGPTLYNSNGGEIYITKGKFEAKSYDSTMPDAPLKYKSNPSEIKVSGGSYYKWNPKEHLWIPSDFKGYFEVQTENDWHHVIGKLDIEENDNKDEGDISDAIKDDRVDIIDIDKDLDIGKNYEFPEITHDITLNFNGTTMEGEASQTTKQWYIFYINGGNVVMNDVTLIGGGIQVYGGGSLIFNGSLHAIWQVTSRASFYIAQSGQVTINGGNFTTNNYNSCYFATINSTGAVLTINSGNFERILNANGNAENSFFNIATPGKVIINGGTFNFTNTKNADGSAWRTGSVIISGGSFKFNPTTWLAEGYKAEKPEGSSYWVVSPI